MRKPTPAIDPNSELACLRAEVAELKAAIRAALPADVTKHGGFYFNVNGDKVHRIEMVPEAYARLVTAITRHSGPIPSGYFNLVDLLQKIASPTSNPNLDVAGLTMMDYWRRDAEHLLPAVKSGEITVDEETWNLMQDAAVTAQSLRNLREEYRSRSANFPTSVPVQWAQDGAKVIEGLIAAFKARFAGETR
jgi:hypothetical protein